MSNVVKIPNSDYSIKIKVLLERRQDGGLRAWSNDLPGFVLSHKDGEAVLKDVPIALEGILSDKLCHSVKVELLVDINSISRGEIAILDQLINGHSEQEYVAQRA